MSAGGVRNRRAGARGDRALIMTCNLRLTLLPMDIVETILGGKQGPEVMLARVMQPFPAEWEGQVGQVAPRESKLHVTDQVGLTCRKIAPRYISSVRTE